MLAAVVHPRGGDAAAETLAQMGSGWRIDARGGAVVARTDDSSLKCVLVGPLSASEANNRSGAGALVALERDGDGVIVARGSLGGRPLFHASTKDGAWVVCSRMEPLLSVLGRGPMIDADRVASLVAGLPHVRVESTVWNAVSRVAPCTAVRLTPDGRTSTFVRPTRERSEMRGTVDDLAAELWRRIEASVRRTIGDAKRVGVLVGGVDSSGLLAAAVAVTRGASASEALALTLDFDDEFTDRPFVADLARELDLVPVRLDPRDAAPYLRDSIESDAQPYTYLSGSWEALAAARAKELGVDFLLTGQLGDDVLNGDPRTIANEARRGSPISAMRRAARLRLPWPTTERERVTDYVVRPLVKPFVPPFVIAAKQARDAGREYSWAGPRLVSMLAALREQPPPLAPRTPGEHFERFARSNLYADIIDACGQSEAKTGLRREDPYADEDILDLVTRVPVDVLFHGDLHRGLYRAALRGHVPESVRTRTTKSWFEPAFAEVVEAAGGLSTFGALWEGRALADLGIVDGPAFRRILEPFLRGATGSAELACFGVQAIACESFCAGSASSR